MIFRRIVIDGFGVWNNLVLEDLDRGLNVFMAPNEGGKSTLMAFIRAVLFGFKKRGHASRYQPINGGKHGGYIDVEEGADFYRIARFDDGSSRGAVRLSDGDGEQLPEGRLEELLHHTSETLYESIFAFGLEELQRLETLQDEEIAAHIYSAGMGSGALGPVAFRSQVQQSMADLYRPRGKKQPIAKHLAEIEELDRKIAQLRKHQPDYGDLIYNRARLRERVSQHDIELEQLEKQLDELQRIQRAWPHYEKLLAAEEELEARETTAAEVEPNDPGRPAEAWWISGAEKPDAGPDRPVITTASRIAVEVAVSLEDEGLATARGESSAAASIGSSTAPDLTELLSPAMQFLLLESQPIRSLIASAASLKLLHRSMLQQQGNAQSSKQAFHAAVNDLGEDWSVERIRQIPGDVKMVEEIRSHAELLRRADSEVETTATRAADANLVYEAISARREQISRESLVVSWILICVAVLLTAVLVPEAARLGSTASVLAIGLLIGIVLTLLHSRAAKQQRTEKTYSAAREAELWDENDDAKLRLEQQQLRWRQWLKHWQLPQELSPDGAREQLARIEQVRVLDRHAQESSTHMENGQIELGRHCATVREHLEQLGRSIPETGYDTMKTVEPLLSEIGALQSELAEAEAERELIEGYARARAALRALAGQEKLDEFRHRLGRWTPDLLPRETGKAEAALMTARADRDALSEKIGAISEAIRRLEDDDALSERLLQREVARAKLTGVMEDWVALALTTTLFDGAKQRYEAERQPQLLRLASRYLQRITDGRYVRVIAPLGESRLEVELAENGRRLPPEALSRGTGEQLYLAMRLALVRIYAKGAVALPLVADDILVNFDNARASAAAALLGEFAAEGNQVLAFTCHEHLAETFSQHAPNASIANLPSLPTRPRPGGCVDTHTGASGMKAEDATRLSGRETDRPPDHR